MAGERAGRGGAPNDQMSPDEWMQRGLDELATLKFGLDHSNFAKREIGNLVDGLNRPVGFARGGWHAAQGVWNGATFAGRLLNPLDSIIHEPGEAAWDDVAAGIGNALTYGGKAISNPRVVGNDIADSAKRFYESVEPSATPMADTLAGEINRRARISRNVGESDFGLASALEGGLAVKGLTGLGAMKALTNADYLAAGLSERQIADLNTPYIRTGHHSIAQQYTKGMPRAVRDNPLFVVKPPGITKGDFYQLHFGVDKDFHGARLVRDPAGVKGWSGAKLGLKKYGLLDRIAFGTPEPVKYAGAANAGGLPFNTYHFGDDDAGAQNDGRVQDRYSGRYGVR